MTYTEEQFQRLPKWAQTELRTAEQVKANYERAVAELRAERAQVLQDVAIAALDNPYGPNGDEWRGEVYAYRNAYDDKTPVARARDDLRVYYGPERDDWVDINIREGHVQIESGRRRLIIKAESGNRVYVRSEDW